MKQKNKKFIQYVNTITIILFLVFITIYIFERTGYYEYELHKETVLTQEAIKKFEEDVASGKDVRVEDYIEIRRKNYNNAFSNVGYKLSNYLGDTTRNIIKGTFEALARYMDA